MKMLRPQGGAGEFGALEPGVDAGFEFPAVEQGWRPMGGLEHADGELPGAGALLGRDALGKVIF